MNALERIDAEIATLEAKVTALRYARGIVAGDADDPAPNGDGHAAPATRTTPPRTQEPPAKKSPPPVAPQRPEGNRHEADRNARRLRIAKLLIEHGPMMPGQLEGLVSCASATLRATLESHPWFQRVNPENFKSPWTLTESGRKLAASTVPG